MVDLFGKNIHFVSCEAAVTDMLLLFAIATHLRMPLSAHDAKAAFFDLLLTMPPKVVVLDNFESCWDTEKQQEIHRLLIQISSYKQIHLILTMRENMKPAQIRWDKTIAPGVLSLEFARETFLAIASEASPSSELDQLLESSIAGPSLSLYSPMLPTLENPFRGFELVGSQNVLGRRK